MASCRRMPRRRQVDADLADVLKSQGVTDQSLIDQTIADLHAVNVARNITADDLTTLAADRKAIETDLGSTSTSSQSSSSNPGPSSPGFPGGPLGGLWGV